MSKFIFILNKKLTNIFRFLRNLLHYTEDKITLFKNEKIIFEKKETTQTKKNNLLFILLKLL